MMGSSREASARLGLLFVGRGVVGERGVDLGFFCMAIIMRQMSLYFIMSFLFFDVHLFG